MNYGQASTNSQEVNWTQPILTSNGSLGGNSFAVSASSESMQGTNCPAYQAFTNDTSLRGATQMWAATGNASLTFFNPIPINVTKLDLYIGSNNSYQGITAGNIQASNDNSTWTTLKTFSGLQDGSTSSVKKNTLDLSNNTNSYKYYKITATSSSVHGSGLVCVKITATYIQTAISTITFPYAHTNINYSYALEYFNGTNQSSYATGKSSTGLTLQNNSTATSVYYFTLGY